MKTLCKHFHLDKIDRNCKIIKLGIYTKNSKFLLHSHYLWDQFLSCVSIYYLHWEPLAIIWLWTLLVIIEQREGGRVQNNDLIFSISEAFCWSLKNLSIFYERFQINHFLKDSLTFPDSPHILNHGFQEKKYLI